MARADWHTRRVVWLKVALPLLALAILSTLFLLADRIDPDDAEGTYTVLSEFSPRSKKPYINPCSKDAAQAVMNDNLDPDAPASDRGAVMPPGTGLPTAVDMVREWLECGSPNN